MLGEIGQYFLGGLVAIEPDFFDRGFSAGIAADEGAGRRFDLALLTRFWIGEMPAKSIRRGDLPGGDTPNLFVSVDEIGKIGFGGRFGKIAAVSGRGLNDENGFRSDDAADFVVLAIAAAEDALGIAEYSAVGFADLAQIGPAIFEQGDQGRVVLGGRSPQTKKPDGLRSRRGADHGVVVFVETLDSGRLEGEGSDFRVQADVETVGEDVGEIVVPLEDIKARTVGAGHDLIILVEDGRDDGAELAKAGEEFLFEIARFRGEVLYAGIDEVSLPELGRAATAADGGALENADFDAQTLQGLGAAQPREAGPNNGNGTKFFHCDNVNICVQRAITIRYRLQQIRFAVDFWSGGSSLKSL